MKKLFLLAVAIVLATAAEAQPASKELDLRIGSYNVWSHSARRWQISKGATTESRNWDNSKQAVAELIVKLDCDLLGMQEVTSVCRDDLAKLVKKAGGKKYKLWWVNTYPEGHKNVVGNAVFYDKKKFKFSKQNIYYFSPTPEEMSKGWDEKRHYRAALVTEVEHKKSGKKFFFMATHGPLGDIACGHAGRLLTEFDKKYNTEGLPTIVVGDMNAWQGHKNNTFYENMTKYFEDTFHIAGNKCGTIGTFNGSKEIEKNFATYHRRIDHIYVRSTDKGKITVKNYEVNRDKATIAGEQHYPSDHNPVVVDITLK
jgi:endonuclease/exonuclease/phosphatase family metal-dependent hydrolase